MSNKYRRPLVRTTRNYNADYAYLDDSIELPWQFRILSEHTKCDYESIDLVTRIKVTDKCLTDNQVYKALRDEYLKGCGCEYDCCGHLFGGLNTVEKPHNRKSGEWILKSSYSPNY